MGFIYEFRYNKVFSCVNELLEIRIRRRNIKILHKGVPHGISGLKQCNINKDGVIDFIVLYICSVYTLHGYILLIEVAALGEGDGAGPAKDKRPPPENEEADEEGYGPGFLHILFTMFVTFSMASIRAGWFCVRVWPSPTVGAQETNMRVKEAAMPMVAVRFKLRIEEEELRVAGAVAMASRRARSWAMRVAKRDFFRGR